MSISLIVRLQAERMPDSIQWQQAIVQQGFDLELDTDFDETVFTGFLPCKYQRIKTGFEYHYEEADFTGLSTIEVEFITHSGYREYVASAIAAAILTEISGGTLEETEGGVCYAASEAVAWAKEVEIELRSETTKSQEGVFSAGRPMPTKPWWKFW